MLASIKYYDQRSGSEMNILALSHRYSQFSDCCCLMKSRSKNSNDSDILTLSCLFVFLILGKTTPLHQTANSETVFSGPPT